MPSVVYPKESLNEDVSERNINYDDDDISEALSTSLLGEREEFRAKIKSKFLIYGLDKT